MDAVRIYNARGSALSNSFEAVNDSDGRSVNRSPSLQKNKAVGITKPNNLDPRKLPYDDGKQAGVGTNYGLNADLIGPTNGEDPYNY